MTQRLPVIQQSHSGRLIGIVGDTYRFLATGSETDGRYSQWEAIVPPGGGPPPHFHATEEEGFLVLEGEIVFSIGEEKLVATPGMFANIPAGVPHSFRNETTKTARMLITVAPAGLEEMFFRIGKPLSPGEFADPPSPEAIQSLIQIAPSFGITLLLPHH